MASPAKTIVGRIIGPFTVALAVALLTGCGQKGPLYLPEGTGEVVTRPTQTPATTAPPATTTPSPDTLPDNKPKP